MPVPATTGLTLALDASATTRLWKEVAMTNHPADGELVRAWDDEGDSTGRAMFGAADASSPLYRATGINSKGALDFDGSNDALLAYLDAGSTAQALSNFIANNAFTIFIACQLSGAGSNDGIAGYRNDAIIAEDGGGYFGLFYKTVVATDSLVLYNYDGTQDYLELATGVSRDTPLVVMMRHEGGSLYLSVNNGAEVTAASGNTASLTGQLILGRSTASINFFDGLIGEVRIHNTALSGSDFTNTMQYMLQKWAPLFAASTGGISTLPNVPSFPSVPSLRRR